MNQKVQTSLARITHRSYSNREPFLVILEGLKENKAVSTNSFLYHFKNIEAFELDEKVIYGELYKSKLSSEHEILDLANLTYQPETLNEFFSLNKFVIFTDLSIVFTSRSKFKDDEFIHNFEKLYHLNATELFSQIKINYRKDDFDIFEKIMQFSRLLEVKLKNIRKSNPTPRPTFKKIEALLEKEKTDVFNADFISEKKQGLSRESDSLIMSGISISDSGYGESIIIGQHPNGHLEKINSKDNVIRNLIHDLGNKLDFIRLIIKIYKKYISSEDDLVHD
jgi:hypothetical protein